MDNPPVSILIIDPDDASRKYLAINLGKTGFDVNMAASGKEGLILAWQKLPQVILIDPKLKDMQAVDFISRLRQDRRTAHTPCIAVTEPMDEIEINRLLGAGINEFLVKSNQTITELQRLIPKSLEVEKAKVEGGKLFVFLSAKGGTGTSSLCANIAMCVGKTTSTLKVAVIDMVLPIGSIASIVGYVDRMNIVNVSAQDEVQTTPRFFLDSLPKIPNWYFRLLAGSPDPESANHISVNRLEQVVNAIRETHDYVFIDLGRSLSRISLPIIQRADLLALVLSTDTSAVTLTKVVWDYLETQMMADHKVYPIMNRSVGLEGMTKYEAEEVLGLQIRAAVPYMGGNFALANNRHEPIITKFPGDSVSLMLLQIASQLTELANRPSNH